jgi:transcription-repair coupling factor (superfamily II helicase)
MSLQGLLPLMQDRPEFRRLIDQLTQGEAPPELRGVSESAKPYLLGALGSALGHPLLVVVQDESRARETAETLRLLTGHPEQVIFFPERDGLPYERLIENAEIMQLRMGALARLARKDSTVKASAQTPRPAAPDRQLLTPAPIIITSARALTQPLIPPEELRGVLLEVRVREELDLTLLLEQCIQLGYESVAEVEEPGQITHRGGIVDIFPPTMPRPVRIEFFGDEVESIRTFDQETQRSLNPLETVLLAPAREALPQHGPAAANELERLPAETLHPDPAARWARDLDALRAGQSFDDLVFYLPYLHHAATLLDYLPAEGVLALDMPDRLEDVALRLEEQAEEVRASLEREGENPPGLRAAFLGWSTLWPQLEARRHVRFANFLDEDDLGFDGQQRAQRVPATAGQMPAQSTRADEGGALLPDLHAAPSYGGRLRAFVTETRRAMRERQRVVVVTAQARRLCEVFGDEAQFGEDALQLPPVIKVLEPPEPGTIVIMQGHLVEGWQSRSLALTVLSDTEVFGWSKRRDAVRRKPTTPASFLAELHPGDFVVHQDHGIGRFEGLVKLSSTGVEREYLLIQYAGTDKLYIPTDQLDRVTRFIGMGDVTPALSKLGSIEWTRAKQQVKESVQDIAKDLLRLYSVRETTPGHAFPLDSEQPWLQELEEAFPYEETPDQVRAIAEVKEDMQQPRPMDRLVCGDVGYGKTEVALRAAFKAVLDQKQVAILVPTTILALQHFNTFSERLKAYPVRVELMSRFRSEKEQKQILEELALGRVDILIGTHRILQKDVVFNNLGLLIIDEEQRFGVVHKERLKQLRMEVDVLTLTATPIPRTLHMSLVNVRDMSVIETPPQERLPIRTFIREWDDTLLREIILREIDRGGQVFFVHNRVQGIQVLAQRLQKLLPEATFAVAHGQMHEDQLEQVMLAFSSGEYQVLVCTTIIENGLDIPNANTIIINNAAHFGLAQLYQLRGRVGRGSHQAYAYLLYSKEAKLTPIAEKRLRAIYEATELGAGFRIAMKDLEIRGAGNLLGPEQSGFMNVVGFDLYSKLLAEAIQELQGKKAGAVTPAITVDLPVDAFLPDAYINNRGLKMNFYQRLANLTTREQVEAMEAELADRFGPPPPPVENLLKLLYLKVEAAELGFESLALKDGQVVIKTTRNMVLNRLALYRRFRNEVRVQLGMVQIPRGLLPSGSVELITSLRELLPQISTVSGPQAPLAKTGVGQ